MNNYNVKIKIPYISTVRKASFFFTLSAICYGAQPIQLKTDSSGQFTTGNTWSTAPLTPGGSSLTGTIGQDIDASPVGTQGSFTLVENFSGVGTLSNVQFFSNESRLPSNPIANIKVTLNGDGVGAGTGNFNIVDTNTGGSIAGGSDGTDLGNYFDSFSITNLMGVRSFTFETTFDNPIANRLFNDSNPNGELGFLPWINSIRASTLGTGIINTDYNLTAELIDVATSTDGGTTWNLDTTGMDSLTSPSINAAPAGSTIFTSDQMTPNERQLIKGLDVDGSGAFTNSDLNLAYARGLRYTVALDDNSTIPDDAVFVFTYDGFQQNGRYQDAGNAIPEPASISFLSLAGLSLALRRRRR